SVLEESFSPVTKIWTTSRFCKTFSDGPPMRAGNNFDGCWGTSSNRDDEVAANPGPTGVAGEILSGLNARNFGFGGGRDEPPESPSRCAGRQQKCRNTRVLPAKGQARTRQFQRSELQFKRRRTAAEAFSRVAEALWWGTRCVCCPSSPYRACCLHRVSARLPRSVSCRIGAADRQPTQAHIDSDCPRTQCSREYPGEAVRPDRS